MCPFCKENEETGRWMNGEPDQPEETGQPPARLPYVPPTVEDIDTTSGPADTSAGLPVIPPSGSS